MILKEREREKRLLKWNGIIIFVKLRIIINVIILLIIRMSHSDMLCVFIIIIIIIIIIRVAYKLHVMIMSTSLHEFFEPILFLTPMDYSPL